MTTKDQPVSIPVVLKRRSQRGTVAFEEGFNEGQYALLETIRADAHRRMQAGTDGFEAVTVAFTQALDAFRANVESGEIVLID